MPKGIHIFKSRFVNEIKKKSINKEYTKSRLIVQIYNNAEKTMVLIQSFTIQYTC